MPSDPKYCLAEAVRFIELARRARTLEGRKTFQNLAEKGRGWRLTSKGPKLRWRSSTSRASGDRRPTRTTDPHFCAAKNSSLGQKSACSLSPSRNQSRQVPSESHGSSPAPVRMLRPSSPPRGDRPLAPPSSRPSAPACAAPGRIAASETVHLPSNPPHPRGRGFRLAAIVGHWRGGSRSKP